MSILVTGGAGYIGSHTVLALLEQKFDVVVLDNLSNSSIVALNRVEDIAGKKINIHLGDVLDDNTLEEVFNYYKFEAVIHFAGLKSVSESAAKPLEYYDNNFTSTLHLLAKVKKHNIKTFIFSSSATVYGQPESTPLAESSVIGGTTNPYGSSKLFCEYLLDDFQKANPQNKIIILRYFNPVGAHPSARIGEDPKGIPNNLVPYILQVAVGRLKKLNIYGSDYDTPDGTGIRDYIHVMDLAEGHVAALIKCSEPGRYCYNLGTGCGYSVREVIEAFIKVSGVNIPVDYINRRPGDVAECWSDPSLAQRDLGWKATRDLKVMLRDSWNWQLNNPNGYN